MLKDKAVAATLAVSDLDLSCPFSSSCLQWMFSPLPGVGDRSAPRRRPHTAWTVDDLDAAHARAVEAAGRSVWTPRDMPEPE